MLSNSGILADLETKLNHIPQDTRIPLTELILKYKSLFPDVSNSTKVLMHDMDVDNTSPVKQLPYWVNQIKLEKLRQKVQ